MKEPRTIGDYRFLRTLRGANRMYAVRMTDQELIDSIIAALGTAPDFLWIGTDAKFAPFSWPSRFGATNLVAANGINVSTDTVAGRKVVRATNPTGSQIVLASGLAATIGYGLIASSYDGTLPQPTYNTRLAFASPLAAGRELFTGAAGTSSWYVGLGPHTRNGVATESLTAEFSVYETAGTPIASSQLGVFNSPYTPGRGSGGQCGFIMLHSAAPFAGARQTIVTNVMKYFTAS